MSHVSAEDRVYPEPPFAPELIADFHAGALDDELAGHVRARLPEDPQAQELIDSLDATTAALGELPETVPEVSADVRAATAATLARLENAAPATVVPHRPSGRPVGWRRHPALLGVAAASVALLASGVVVAQLLSPARPASSESAAEVPAGDTARLLAAARGGGSEGLDANRIARCLTANRLGGSGVVGAGYLVYQGKPAQVILTPTGRPGLFNALVTTRDCDAGRPGTLARAVLTQ